MKLCSYDNCSNKFYARSFCSKHYQRYCRYKPENVAPYTYEQHRRSYTTEYYAWENMIARCNYPSYRSRHRYKDRNITVCERWLHSFDNFLADMGLKPTSGHSLDRKDNDGNYELSNCRWATKREQANNQCRIRLLTYQGKTQTVAEWVRELGLNDNKIRGRIRYGWPVERILSS